jgi:hypothetical protein
METSSWTDRVKNEKGLKQSNRMANWIVHILCRNCFLKHVIEGKMGGRIKVTGRRERRRKQLLDDLKEMIGFWKQKEEALDRTLWRNRFGRGCRLVVNLFLINHTRNTE